MIVLAETYLHLAVQPTDRQVSETQAYLEYLAAVSAVERFGQEVALEFRIEQGSLKGWLTVMGAFTVFNNYGSLRQSVDYAVKDGKAFSEFVISRFKTDVPLPSGALYRAERRLGVPGQIQRLFPMLDEASRSIETKNHREATKQIQKVQEHLQRIEAELSESGESDVIKELGRSLPPAIRERMPKPEAPVPRAPQAPALNATRDERVTRRERPNAVLLRLPEPPSPPRFK